MDKIDIAIVGGGVSGLACAMTLVWTPDGTPSELKIAVVDHGKSDAQNALYNNVPGMPPGSEGPRILQEMQSRLHSSGAVTFHGATITRLVRDSGGWTLSGDGFSLQAPSVVLATGYKSFDIDAPAVVIGENQTATKPGRFEVVNQKELQEQELYVAGLLAGAPSMFACASGSGVAAALDLLSRRAGVRVHCHDSMRQKGK